MKENVSILMLVHSYYPDDPRVRREAQALHEAGYQVDIVCLRDGGERAYEIVNGIRTYRLPVKRHRGKGFIAYLAEYLAFFLYAILKVTGLFIQNRYRVIQIHTIPDFLAFCAFVPRLLGSSIILDMHEVMPEFFSYRYQLRERHLLIRLLTLIERIAIRFAHQVITVSDTLKKILITRGVPPDKITVLMNVADDKIFPTETAINRLSKPSQHNRFTMAYHGLLSDVYDLEVVFRALGLLKDKIPHVQFLVIGRGPRGKYYQNLVRRLGLGGIVSFLDHLPQERIPQTLEQVDLGVVPLKDVIFTHIAFPTKFVEYVALGIPTVIARRQTIEHYFNSDCVAFFEPDDGEGLAEIILGLYRAPENRYQLARNALRRYQAIEWPKMKKRYYELMDKTVANI